MSPRDPPGPARPVYGADPLHWHFRWTATNRPVARIAPGERLRLEIPDASSGQLARDSTRADLGRVDLDRVDAAVGPFEVDGARPGDGLRVRIETIDIGDWGWSAVFRDFGLLRGRFDDDLVTWSIQGGVARPSSGFLRPVRIPLRPMLGWVGVAPAEGEHGMIPPRRTGGNMDSRLHGAGATLILPVEVPGALLSLGDPHAAMGDGEVCGTGIEAPARVEVKVEVVPHGAPPFPRVELPRPPPETGPLLVATGIAPDLLDATRLAVENLLARLGEDGLTPKEAYLLASLAGDLRLSEVVDLPNFVVSMTFPRRLAAPGARPAASFKGAAARPRRRRHG